VRKTRAAALESTDDDADDAAVSSAQLGASDKPFRFDQLDTPVTFIPFAAGAPPAKGAQDAAADDLTNPTPVFEWLAANM